MIDVKECPYYLYNENYHQKENCTRSGSFSEGNPPCTRDCKWFVQQELKELEKELEEQEALTEKYEQALDEIEKYFKSKDKTKTSLFNIFAIEQEILDIINKAKETNERRI